jgi:hypothetical protein
MARKTPDDEILLLPKILPGAEEFTFAPAGVRTEKTIGNPIQACKE